MWLRIPAIELILRFRLKTKAYAVITHALARFFRLEIYTCRAAMILIFIHSSQPQSFSGR